MVLSFSEAAAQAVRGTVCTVLAASDNATRWINGAYGLDADFGNIAGALRRSVCNESDPDTSGYGPTPSIQGGQCSTIYNLEYDTENGQVFCADNSPSSGYGNIETDTRNSVLGPIEYVRTEFSSFDRCGNGSPGGYRYVIKDGNGSTITLGNAFSGVSFLYQDKKPFVAIRATRADGQPDDCGNGAPLPIDQYNDFTQTVSITYNDNTETEVTEDIDITLGPLIVGIGGAVYAPVTLTAGGVEFSGTVELAPEFSVSLYPSGGGGGGTSEPIPDPSRPDPAPEPEDRRDRIIGAVVTVTGFDEELFQGTQVSQASTPDLLLPRVGNVSFYVETSGGQAWTEPAPVKTVRAYMPCPAREGAVDVALTTETGVTAQLTPVYAELALPPRG